MASNGDKPHGKATQGASDKAAEKAAKRLERNALQAAEESLAWNQLKSDADKAVQAYRRRGRIDWNESLESEILDRLANGQSLQSICEPDHMPAPSTVLGYVERNPSFAERYVRAREHQGTVLLDQCLRIADDDSRDLIPASDESGEVQVNHAAIQRDKMRIDTRMRMAGKYNLRLADKPPTMDGANITVNNNTLQLDARALDVSQRDSLRQLLLQARANADGKTIDGD
jgi:hypothetical protein